MTPAAAWHLPRGPLGLDRPHLLGIINCTPDSFSDGGRWRDAAHAVDGALAMLEDASGVDVGGESTRPGASRVSAAEQRRRVIPVIEGIREKSDAIITVDTTLSDVAEAALDAGADAINDVAAGAEDASMFELAARRGCGLVLMHRHSPPGEDRFSTDYAGPPMTGDVPEQVHAWLEARARAAEAAGVMPGAICVDPGLGFGKSVSQNWALMAAADRLVAAGRPALAASSRKSFIKAVAGVTSPAELDSASAMVTLMQLHLGLRLFRVHEVQPHLEAMRLAGVSMPQAC